MKGHEAAMGKTGKVDRLEQIDRLWPVDGPHDSDTITEAAEAIDRLTRYLNHATRTRLRYVNTVHAVTAALAAANHKQDQLFTQLRQELETFAEDPTLYDDRNLHNPETTAHLARYSLLEAFEPLEQATEHLTKAANHLSHLGNHLGSSGNQETG